MMLRCIVSEIWVQLSMIILDRIIDHFRPGLDHFLLPVNIFRIHERFLPTLEAMVIGNLIISIVSIIIIVLAVNGHVSYHSVETDVNLINVLMINKVTIVELICMIDIDTIIITLPQMASSLIIIEVNLLTDVAMAGIMIFVTGINIPEGIGPLYLHSQI